MAITNFKDLLATARANGPKAIVAVGAQQDSTLEAVAAAKEEGIARPILVGDEPKILEVASACGVDVSTMLIIHEPDIGRAARRAMMLPRWTVSWGYERARY